MIEQREALEPGVRITDERSNSRSRSRSRSRDRYDRVQRLKSTIIRDSIDEDASFQWGLKDDHILEQILFEKVDDQQAIKRFRQTRLHNKKEENYFDGKQQLTYEQYIEKEKEFHDEQELIRAFFRMEQGREQPVDRFIKAAYIYKGKMKFEKNPHITRVMKQPKEYLEDLSVEELKGMIPEAIIHSKADLRSETKFTDYWEALIQLIEATIEEKGKEQEVMSKQTQQRVNKIMNKPLPDLLKMQKSILQIQKQNLTFNQNTKFWNGILKKIKIKKLENVFSEYYQRFQESHEEERSEDSKEENRVITSPILHSKDIIAPKFVALEEDEVAERNKIAERIFKESFEKSIEKLESNLSLPKNHNLLEENIITDVNATYDYIAEEILEFERYKRLEEDEENFNDWLPIETEGRFRDRKPEYVNRVRMAFEWNRYNQLHYTTDNPPPKTVQGYKFNIFYPHLLDKTKTPQYYLQATETTDFAIIKFKAGPPYEDLAFRIVNREWDFSEKSGFESIFAKGILHLYFNFKKPRYRI